VNADHELARQLKALGVERGFARSGIARAELLTEDAARLRAWLAAGQHGEMAYMQRSVAVRPDPAHPDMLPSARSVIALAAAVPAPPLATAELPRLFPGRVARYAQGRDYHNVLRTKLRPLVRLLRERGHTARETVDVMPLLERAWAQRAGIGFIGKNSCLIVPGLGSHVMLAAIVTSAELPADAPMRERCGECRRCLDICPTRAFVGPRDLDARRCISYLTIEHRGEIDAELRPAMGDWLFGCDACQDVCPYNRIPEREPCMPGLDAPRPWHALDAEQLLQRSDAELLALTEGSPLRRPGPDGLRRNAAIALANTRGRRSLPVVAGPPATGAPDARPPIASQRLRAEPVELRHAAAMSRVLSDPRIWRYLADGPPALASLERQYAFLGAGKSPDGTEHWLTWILFEREPESEREPAQQAEPEPIGFIQATIKEPETAHIAYALHPSHWRKGYAREAISALLDLAFARYRVARAVAEMDTRNDASIALARALGFRHVGTSDTPSGQEHAYELAPADWRRLA